MEYPCISICMPIFERNQFTQIIMSNITNFDYPMDKLEFVIDDDGIKEKFISSQKELQQLSEAIHPIKLNYNHYTTKRSIGKKRNNLVKLASHKLIAFMDSDDLYLPTYLKHSLEIMKKEKAGLVCSNQMLFLYPFNDWKATGIQCGHKYLGHEATMLFTKKYFKAMGGFENSSRGEGVNFIKGMRDNSVALSRIDKCMICICHKKNTVSKDLFLDNSPVDMKLSDYDKFIISQALGLN